jgi:hypothetical protein
MGFASAGGIWLPFVYVQETASWAAQGKGQDIVNLAVVLPAMIATSILLWKRHPLGLLWAVPLVTFAAAMASSIVGMMIVMKITGLAVPAALIAAMAISASLALYLDATVLLPKIRHPRAIPE